MSDDLCERLRVEFLPAILHGDEEHRAWLTEAVECFIAGKPLPKPRGGGSATTIERLRAELEATREAAEDAGYFERRASRIDTKGTSNGRD